MTLKGHFGNIVLPEADTSQEIQHDLHKKCSLVLPVCIGDEFCECAVSFRGNKELENPHLFLHVEMIRQANSATNMVMKFMN